MKDSLGSSNKQASIFFVGPLPPPVHGFAEINRRMLVHLSKNADIEVFDVTPRKKSRGLFAKANSWLSLVLQFFKFTGLALRGNGDVLYLPLSGGYRQFIDASFAIIGLLSGLRIFIHHHSFAYINHRPLYARIVLRLLRNATHIVLCERMGSLLSDSYSISKDNIRVLSNAAFLDDAPHYNNKKVHDKKLVLGFLSNITASKGCFEFIELIKAATDKGLVVEGFMAGPVQPEIDQSFSQAIASTKFVSHIGPVYGEAKHNFFEKIDVLVFPTQYENEAEPVTIWEALEASVPVIALSRGCIECIVPENIGWVIKNPDHFIEQGLECLDYILEDVSTLGTMKVEARKEFEKAKQKYTIHLEALLLEIMNGKVNAKSI